MFRYNFAIIGGDSRISCMASILAKEGYSVACFGVACFGIACSGVLPCGAEDAPDIHTADSLKAAVEGAGVIIAGIPFAKNDCLYCEGSSEEIKLAELQRCLRKHQKIFGGVIPDAFRHTCEERDIECYDFMADEPITLFNAVATAEGAVLEALAHKQTNLHMSSALVLGYGRCAKTLADKLKGLSAKVTVCSADENELALATSLGFNTLPLSRLDAKIGSFEYIFNTIPAKVLTKETLEKTDKEALIIDIASNMAGADYDAAKSLGVNILFCPGLPGKYACKSCAERLAKYVIAKSGYGQT